MNMCSLRQRPMPSAPNSGRAWRPPACRRWPARRAAGSRRPSVTTCWKSSFTCGGTSGSAPANTSPVERRRCARFPELRAAVAEEGLARPSYRRRSAPRRHGGAGEVGFLAASGDPLVRDVGRTTRWLPGAGWRQQVLELARGLGIRRGHPRGGRDRALATPVSATSLWRSWRTGSHWAWRRSWPCSTRSWSSSLAASGAGGDRLLTRVRDEFASLAVARPTIAISGVPERTRAARGPARRTVLAPGTTSSTPSSPPRPCAAPEARPKQEIRDMPRIHSERSWSDGASRS